MSSKPSGETLRSSVIPSSSFIGGPLAKDSAPETDGSLRLDLSSHIVSTISGMCDGDVCPPMVGETFLALLCRVRFAM